MRSLNNGLKPIPRNDESHNSPYFNLWNSAELRKSAAKIFSKTAEKSAIFGKKMGKHPPNPDFLVHTLFLEKYFYPAKNGKSPQIVLEKVFLLFQM